MNKKPTIICGITNMDGIPVERTKEEIEQFKEMMNSNGEYNVIFDDTNTIPIVMNTIAMLSHIDN